MGKSKDKQAPKGGAAPPAAAVVAKPAGGGASKSAHKASDAKHSARKRDDGQHYHPLPRLVLTARVTLAFWVPTDGAEGAARAVGRQPGLRVNLLVRCCAESLFRV